MIIAIDGFSGAGKGTLASYLASRFYLRHLDTGLLYRAVAYQALLDGIDLNDQETLVAIARNLDIALLTHPKNLKAEEVGSAASYISTFVPVREALLNYQRDFAKDIPPPYKGVVLDGRDIGTFVFPKADLKFFITASIEVRAKRRLKELGGDIKQLEEIKNLIHQRDERDQTRAVCPLKKAEDAIVIDTSDLSINDVYSIASSHVLELFNKLGIKVEENS